MNYTLEQIEEAFKKASPNIQQTLQSEDTGADFAAIAGAFDLSEEQFTEYVDETGLLLLKLTPFAEYERNLAARLKLDNEHTRAIVERTGADILAPFSDIIGWQAPVPKGMPPSNLPTGSNPPTGGSTQADPGSARFAGPETNEALERLEDAREKQILGGGLHSEKLGGMVSTSPSQTTVATPAKPAASQPNAGDPYREPIS